MLLGIEGQMFGEETHDVFSISVRRYFSIPRRVRAHHPPPELLTTTNVIGPRSHVTLTLSIAKGKRNPSMHFSKTDVLNDLIC